MNQYIRQSSKLIFASTKAYACLNHNINFSIRMASNYLINDSKYSFLKELGLNEKNHGVFAKHGKWCGEGDIIDSICPSNNRPIASVIQGNERNYEHCIEESVNAWKIWADVIFRLVNCY